MKAKAPPSSPRSRCRDRAAECRNRWLLRAIFDKGFCSGSTNSPAWNSSAHDSDRRPSRLSFGAMMALNESSRLNVEPRVESPMSNVDDRNDPCALVAVVISEPDCPSPRIDPAVGYDEQRRREARLEPRYSDEHDGQLMMALHVAVVISESDGR
ncbi:hypothetical protein THAOC_26099 [Thalassiosira oceanica]|uniref:Uncharacterized protein n=1 Tax=Thalassiosira oceanica TaxID=159749 RepID=K0S603_THAOC|nr:hypothetical protein THAOC_26099 [Thalassiosira oceanica]|eukprot:EJK54292.1 hypothetical protein THAOC_26099 [Thalassiosira oceanica]